MLYFIIYPRVMAFNVEENAVFIPEFSKKIPYRGPHPPRAPSLCPPPPPPLKTPGYGSECILSSHIMIYVHTKFGAQSMAAIGGGGGGHERPPFFQLPKIAQSYKS